MKVKEIIKLIEVDGWYFSRQNGSHRQYKHPIKKALLLWQENPVTTWIEVRKEVF